MNNISRVDKLTELLKKEEVYSDFTMNLDVHPLSGKLLKSVNEEAVKRSLKSRIMTNFGERLYQPFIGSKVRKSLFEPNDIFLEEDLVNSIEHSIQNDKRVNLVTIIIDRQPDKYEIKVTILFTILNNPNIITLDVFLKRVR